MKHGHHLFSRGKFIVKVQIPIVTSATEAKALIYDQSRRLMEEHKISPKLLVAMGSDIKAFFWARMVGTELHLEERAKWQQW